MKNIGLVPLQNFAQLNNNLYRCAQPLYDYQYQWLKEVLNIKTIINLRDENHHDDNYGIKYGINVINIDVPDHKTPSKEQCEQFMNIIKNNKEPLLIHCEHGHGRTSTFCVLARLAEGWNVNEAIKEEEEKYHYNFKHHSQKQFLINNF
jgi:protein-tyrosine phosphatase